MQALTRWYIDHLDVRLIRYEFGGEINMELSNQMYFSCRPVFLYESRIPIWKSL